MAHRDAPRVERRRNPERVRRDFEAFALHTGCVVDAKTPYDAAGIARTTAVAYEEWLHGRSIVHTQPAMACLWSP